MSAATLLPLWVEHADIAYHTAGPAEAERLLRAGLNHIALQAALDSSAVVREARASIERIAETSPADAWATLRYCELLITVAGHDPRCAA